jgi:hypothetical protein
VLVVACAEVYWTGWYSWLAVGQLVRPPVTMMCVGAMIGQSALFLVTPFIIFLGLACVARMVALY